MTREEAISQVRLAGLVCVGLHPDPPVKSLPYPSRTLRAFLDGRRRAGRLLLALAEDAAASRTLAAEAWADAVLDDGRVFYSQVIVPELALLDTILLAALEAEVPEPAEIQTDAGIYERRGTDYSFATWAQLEEAP